MIETVCCDGFIFQEVACVRQSNHNDIKIAIIYLRKTHVFLFIIYSIFENNFIIWKLFFLATSIFCYFGDIGYLNLC